MLSTIIRNGHESDFLFKQFLTMKRICSLSLISLFVSLSLNSPDFSFMSSSIFKSVFLTSTDHKIFHVVFHILLGVFLFFFLKTRDFMLFCFFLKF